MIHFIAAIGMISVIILGVGLYVLADIIYNKIENRRNYKRLASERLAKMIPVHPNCRCTIFTGESDVKSD